MSYSNDTQDRILSSVPAPETVAATAAKVSAIVAAVRASHKPKIIVNPATVAADLLKRQNPTDAELGAVAAPSSATAATAFSSLFNSAHLAAAFDGAVLADAANGRVHAPLAAALLSSYGLVLPSSPRAAATYTNDWLTLDKAPIVARGPGARAAAPAIAQALHALMIAIHAAGKVNNLPALAGLPVWADPAAIAAKKAATAAKRAETKAAKPAIAPSGDADESTESSESSESSEAKQTAPDVSTAANLTIAALRAGSLSPALLQALRDAMESAVTI